MLYGCCATRAFDDPLILSGIREMLWLEYEASKEMHELSVRGVIEKVAEHMNPFPVAAFDTGPFVQARDNNVLVAPFRDTPFSRE
jgi:hypothetical protein